MARPLSDFFWQHKNASRRPAGWEIRMLHPVTGQHLYTLECSTKRDAIAEAAWNIRPDRAPQAPTPRYAPLR